MKKWIAMLLVGALLVLPVMNVFAVEGENEISGGTVEWNGSKLKDDLRDIGEAVSDMQPGDSITYTVAVKNSGSEDADFWMSNEILQSFEDNGKASDGAYTYYLAYTGPDGTEVFYNSAAVGGDDSTGLHEVPDGIDSSKLGNDFFLGTLAKGQSGTVTLRIALDGETQGNAYQNATAGLQLKFGVEGKTTTTNVVKKSGNRGRSGTASGTKNVRTGDEFPILPFSVAAVAAGILLLVIAGGRRKKSAGR